MHVLNGFLGLIFRNWPSGKLVKSASKKNIHGKAIVEWCGKKKQKDGLAVAAQFLMMKKEILSQNMQKVRFFDWKKDPPENLSKVLQ